MSVSDAMRRTRTERATYQTGQILVLRKRTAATARRTGSLSLRRFARRLGSRARRRVVAAADAAGSCTAFGFGGVWPHRRSRSSAGVAIPRTFRPAERAHSAEHNRRRGPYRVRIVLCGGKTDRSTNKQTREMLANDRAAPATGHSAARAYLEACDGLILHGIPLCVAHGAARRDRHRRSSSSPTNSGFCSIQRIPCQRGLIPGLWCGERG